jgi:hypothetical protein
MMTDLRFLSRKPRIVSPRWWGFAAVLVVSITVGLALQSRRGVEHGAGFAAAAAFVDSLIARSNAAEHPRDVSFGDAVALGYLERQRIGLGSPFRLAEHAMRDPRLDSTARRRVAAALLQRTLTGRAYTIDPAALAAIGPSAATDSSGLGARRAVRHLALIEGEVAGAGDPRVGELAVRLAYMLAAAERSVDRSAVSIAAPVAAFVRDRREAAADARRLLRAARAEAADPFELLVTWRRERRFAVERPTAEIMGESLEVEAMERVPALLDSVRAVVAGGDTARSAPLDASTAATPILGGLAAARLSTGVARYAPPQAPVVTGARHYGAALIAAPGSPWVTLGRRELVKRAVNEESFVAEVARLAAREGSLAAAARLVVGVAAALRPYSQETAWFPGDDAPSEDDLRREFGVASVRFDAGIPMGWRPYYRRMLTEGLRDLRRILPALTLDGARIRFRSGTLAGATLAMHDPGSRTIHLPIATSAGALAHEVAHDLDWQMGRRRYGRRGSYGTDVVVREQRGRLAASLRGLTSARLIPPAGANAARPPDDVRPAEVFARTLDWFVSIALAREGRVNGYLSAVQDEVLSGHVAVLPRDAGGWSAQALASVLEEMTLVGAPLREWLLAQWGPARARRPYALAWQIVATPVPRRGEPATPGSILPSEAGPVCTPVARDRPARARAALAALAADARARGVLRGRAQRYQDGSRPPWAESVLGHAPWSPEPGEDAVRRLSAAMLSRIQASGTGPAGFAWSDAATRGELPWRVAGQIVPAAICDLPDSRF